MEVGTCPYLPFSASWGRGKDACRCEARGTGRRYTNVIDLIWFDFDFDFDSFLFSLFGARCCGYFFFAGCFLIRLISLLSCYFSPLSCLQVFLL